MSSEVKKLIPGWLIYSIVGILLLLVLGGGWYYWEDLSSWFERGGALSVNEVNNSDSDVLSNNSAKTCGYKGIEDCVNGHKPFPPGLTSRDYEWSCEQVLKCKP